jgi:hypothetical protein
MNVKIYGTARLQLFPGVVWVKCCSEFNVRYTHVPDPGRGRVWLQKISSVVSETGFNSHSGLV